MTDPDEEQTDQLLWQAHMAIEAAVAALPAAEMAKVARDIAKLYQVPGCSVGGPLHVIVDDSNVGDATLNWVLRDGYIEEWNNRDRWHPTPRMTKAEMELARGIAQALLNFNNEVVRLLTVEAGSELGYDLQHEAERERQ